MKYIPSTVITQRARTIPTPCWPNYQKIAKIGERAGVGLGSLPRPSPSRSTLRQEAHRIVDLEA
uniref:Uncharacterized protein n=1 Tax=uncultured alpha proteobacterium HF0130_06E21 TaxID=710808 RepID=E0XSZ7_9PROT|nr:hypothetical protein [uncultured alpha proteobacterium HF0130_06E21]